MLHGNRGERIKDIVTTRGGQLLLPIPDDEFWEDFDQLRSNVAARDDHYVLPLRRTRKFRPKQARGYRFSVNNQGTGLDLSDIVQYKVLQRILASGSIKERVAQRQ